MLNRKRLLTAGVFAAIALVIPAAAAPQELNTNQRTFFTFSAPVQLPGATLQAGKYQFQLANSASNRHIVQVYNADGSKMITTILAIAAQRNDVPNDAEIRFFETPANMPPAIQTWWFPGTRTGHEFIYPKDVATQLAKTNKGVLTAGGDARTGELTRLSGNGEAKVADNEPAMEVSGKSLRGEMPNAGQMAPPEPGVARTPAPAAMASAAPATSREPRTALPHTASNGSLVGIGGLMSLAAGLLVLVRRRQFAV
jgi:LPXTG-motif cell wall-anchored protein